LEIKRFKKLGGGEKTHPNGEDFMPQKKAQNRRSQRKGRRKKDKTKRPGGVKHTTGSGLGKTWGSKKQANENHNLKIPKNSEKKMWAMTAGNTKKKKMGKEGQKFLRKLKAAGTNFHKR